MKLRVLLITVLLLGMTASAQPLNGTVYGVYPEGVMLEQAGVYSLIPTQHATFELAGLRASWSTLVPGQSVNVLLPPAYLPSIVRIPDPYAWKMKYHPQHPHGGPPGQMKKMSGPGSPAAPPGQGNNGKGNNGNGKGKNR